MDAAVGARRALWLTGIAHASTHAWELVFPAVAVPMARELGLSVEQTVSLSFVLYLLFGLGAPVSGWLSDVWGPRKVLLVGLILGGISGVATALAAHGLWLQVALGGLGLAASLYHPAGLSLLSVHFEKNVGRAFGINGMAGNVGIAGTPFVAGLIASMFGWRWAYVALCAPALLFGVWFLFLPFEDAHHRKSKEEVLPSAPTRIEWSSLIALAVAVTAGGLAYRLHTLVVPALLQERIPALSGWASSLGITWLHNADNLAATLLTTLAYAMGTVGQWWGGKIADARPLASSYLGFHVAAAPLVALAAVLYGAPLVVALFAFLFFSIGMQPIENSLVAKLTPAAWRGRAYAGKFILSFGVGAFGAHIVGWVAPFGGLGASLGVAALMELVLIASIAVIWRIDVRRRTVLA